MLLCKLRGRDGPTSMNEDRYPCPYCSATTPDVLAYSQLAKSPNSPLPSIMEQHQRDCAHGFVNVLYTVEMPLVQTIVVNECGMTRKTWAKMFSSDGADAPPAAAAHSDDPTQAHYLQHSISNAVEFFTNNKYFDFVNVMRLRE